MESLTAAFTNWVHAVNQKGKIQKVGSIVDRVFAAPLNIKIRRADFKLITGIQLSSWNFSH
jgi:hypothetical protein